MAPACWPTIATPFPDRKSDCRDIPIVALDLRPPVSTPQGCDPQHRAGRDRPLRYPAWHRVQHRAYRPRPGCDGSDPSHHRRPVGRAGAPIEQLLPELLQRLAGKPMLVHYSAIEQNFISSACQRLYGGPSSCRSSTPWKSVAAFQRRNHTIQPGDLRLFNLRPRYNLPQYKAHNAPVTPWQQRSSSPWPTTFILTPCPLGEFRAGANTTSTHGRKKPNIHKTLFFF